MSALPKIKENLEEIFQVILVGNANVGKSVLFNHLTGAHVTVSNYPGTTIDFYEGTGVVCGKRIHVIDTPGLASLEAVSEDEKITRAVLFNQKADAVVQVGDSKNLRRTLFLTLQLLETGLPLTLVLNMIDEAYEHGLRFDINILSQLLNIPVVLTSAIHGQGLKELESKIFGAARGHPMVHYPQEIEKAIQSLMPFMPQNACSARSLALRILSAGSHLGELFLQLRLAGNQDAIASIVLGTQKFFREPLSYVIAMSRFKLAEKMALRVQSKISHHESKLTRFLSKLGTLCVHPFLGLLVLAVVLFLAYEFVGVLGAGFLVNWFENTVFGEYLSPWLTRLFDVGLPQGSVFNFFRDLVVGEYGLVTMGISYSFAIILPIVSTFFIAFSIIEDSGYLPRLAYMINNLFKKMGLNGKAVIPMVLGLGCDTMATLTARIMETKKEQILVTLLLALGIPCSAQLGVILGMFGQIPIWAGIVWMGTVFAVLLIVGWSAAKLLPGKGSNFIMEVPPLRIPRLQNILTKTLARLEWYLKEAVPLFLYATLALFLLDRLHLLIVIQKFGEPLVSGILNLPAQASEAFLIGFLRRDFGATRFFDLYLSGKMDVIQAVVSMVVITLFIPCVANVLIIVKERGWKIATAMAGFIFPFAFAVGGLLNFILRRVLL